ncbi:MAG TPA: GTP cyclohydrolase I FolE [Galbitalea sp.]|nr:GTP cyclohydrolase I FolE [Galbitalea sp.]
MAPIDTGRVEAAVAEILAAIGEDPSRPGLATTPARVAESYADFFSGLGVDPLSHLSDATELNLAPDELGELVLLRDIDFRSMCEHHLLPFTGVAHVAYIPAQRIVGLGKIPRVVETLSSRPQLQERLTEEIAQALEDGLAPRGVLVVLDATHGCVTARGVRQTKSTTVTLATRGTLSDPIERSGVLALLGQAGTAGVLRG